MICTSGCLVVFHNKQVKRSWYSHSRERAVVFSLKTVVFSLKCLSWKNGQMFVCLVKKSFGLCPHGLRKACPGLPILSWDSQASGHVDKALRLVNKQPLLSEQGTCFLLIFRFSVSRALENQESKQWGQPITELLEIARQNMNLKTDAVAVLSAEGNRRHYNRWRTLHCNKDLKISIMFFTRLSLI